MEPCTFLDDYCNVKMEYEVTNLGNFVPHRTYNGSRLQVALKLRQPLSASSLVQSANQCAVLLAAPRWAGDSGWGQTDSVCSGQSYSRGKAAELRS